jgi:phosphatidylinositol glycan class W
MRTGWSAALSGVRAYTLLLTACCILAVDFGVFPRRFAKTERAGFSPMDAGVGLVQLLGALVHDRPAAAAAAGTSSRSRGTLSLSLPCRTACAGGC